MNVDQFKSLSKTQRANWTCTVCDSSTRRKQRNPNTPVRQQNQSPLVEKSVDISLVKSGTPTSMPPPPPLSSRSEPISTDKFNELLSTINEWRNDMNTNMMNIREDIKGTLLGIQTDMKSLRTDQATLKLNVANISTEIKSVQDSLQFQADDHTALKNRVEDLAHIACEQTTSACSCLESKIDSLEQQARQCNLEICNVPERRNENLMGILEAIGAATRFQFSQRDIVSLHRVPQAQQGGERPKNIIVKFTTRMQRDNILSAYRRVKSLKSDQLGILGTSSIIYLNEHLTLKRKQLFRRCREVAKELQYRYIWVKNSTILVRERDDSPAIAIRTEKDLEKLKPTTKNNPS